jgi:hypothetical protein
MHCAGRHVDGAPRQIPLPRDTGAADPHAAGCAQSSSAVLLNNVSSGTSTDATRLYYVFDPGF